MEIKRVTDCCKFISVFRLTYFVVSDKHSSISHHIGCPESWPIESLCEGPSNMQNSAFFASFSVASTSQTREKFQINFNAHSKNLRESRRKVYKWKSWTEATLSGKSSTLSVILVIDNWEIFIRWKVALVEKESSENSSFFFLTLFTQFFWYFVW